MPRLKKSVITTVAAVGMVLVVVIAAHAQTSSRPKLSEGRTAPGNSIPGSANGYQRRDERRIATHWPGRPWVALQTSSQSHWPLPTESSVLKRSPRSASPSIRRVVSTGSWTALTEAQA
jgi:hypothetical protein